MLDPKPSPDVPTGRMLPRVLRMVLRPPWLTVFSVLNVIVALHAALAYLLAISGPLGPDAEVVTGDYLAFLTGATIVADGPTGALYDFDHQRRIQASIAGVALDAWQPYVNPPLLAIALRPLAALDFDVGFRLFGFATIALAALGLLAFARCLPTLKADPLSALTFVTLCLGFAPLTEVLPGRQNLPITLALLGSCLWALQRRRWLLAGVLVGLLGYKPQFLLPVLALLVWCRAWRTIGGATIVLGMHYLAGAWLMSAAWPIDFLSRTAVHASLEWNQNPTNQFSLLPFFRTLVPGVSGTLLGLVAVIVTVVALVRTLPRARPGEPGFPLCWSMVVLAGMLASPYLQYYEFGLLVLPVAAGIDAMHRRGQPPPPLLLGGLVAAFFGVVWLRDAGSTLVFQPLTLIAGSVFAWLCRIGLNARSAAQQKSP